MIIVHTHLKYVGPILEKGVGVIWEERGGGGGGEEREGIW
jgi:hypothetical protein